MIKKLVLLASAVAALAALVSPAGASATPHLTSGGVLVPVNTEITGTANDTNLRLTTETGLGEIECESIMLNGRVTENNGTSIKGVGTVASTTSGCTWGEVPTEIIDITINDLGSNMVEGETGTGTFHLAYEANLVGEIICKFSNVGKTAGVFHYTLGSDILHITRTSVGGLGCGEAFLEGTVKLETAPPGSGAIIFS